MQTGERRIERLQKDVADQITSQQIIPTLHQCIKELVDNSIDAKATLIKIQLHQYGKINFSVFDNGSGIVEVQKLGEGGNTSKLKINQNTKEDYLEGIRTLGFRGQALNSIGHLCKDMVIHTVFQEVLNETKNRDLIQTKYSVTQRAIIEKKTSFAKQTFTKISVEGLFYTLPVRKHQLDSRPKQNIKKVYELVFQISLIYPEITFVLINIVEGKQEILFNIQKSKCQRMSQKLSDEEYFYRDIPRDQWKERIQICFPKKLDDSLAFIKSKNVQGFILNTIDSGSSKKNLKFSKNYEFTFINRRPVNSIKEICKVFDGYYKKYNPYTKYVFFLNLKVEPNEIDVNLSPNKRDIFIKKEMLEEILRQIRELIEKEVIEKIINLEEFREARLKKSQKLNEDGEQEDNSNRKSVKNQKSKVDQNDSINIRKQVFRANISQSVQDRSINGNYLGNYRPITSQNDIKNIRELNRRINMTKIQVAPKPKSYESVVQDNSQKEKDVKKKKSYAQDSQSQSEEPNSESEERQRQREKQEKIAVNIGTIQSQELKNKIFLGLQQRTNYFNRQKQEKKQEPVFEVNKIRERSSLRVRPVEIYDLEKIQERDEESRIIQVNNTYVVKREEEQVRQKMEIQKPYNARQISESQSHFSSSQSRNFKENQLKHSQTKKQESHELSHLQISSNLNYVTEQNRGDINKEDFKKFHIHGQFNKGFILCSFKEKQYLYIIDQHASEQKRLFESFMESKPEFYYFSKQISLTPLQVDQIETARPQLTSSGFTFVIENRSVLKLIKCPSHFKKNFGLDEFMQIVDTNKNIKEVPSFYNAAASKACRSAVMIGDELIKNKMIDIVHRMSDLKSPWNCPHGRPSLISLGNFKSIIGKIQSPKPVYQF